MGIWASKTPQHLHWGNKYEMKLVLKGQGIQYLGMLVGFKLLKVANFE